LFIQSIPGLLIRPEIMPAFSLDAAGVLSTGSSGSRSNAISSEESSESESESDPNMFTLLTELERVVRSWDKDHKEVEGLLLGESSTLLIRLRRLGI
jgi:hypothetical protein